MFSNYAASKNGDILSLKTKRIICMTKNSGGYLKFKYTYLQHRFVYEVFKGPIPRCLEIDHINNIKTDNGIKNLQLLNHKKNIEKSISKPIISINIKTGKKKIYISIKTAAIKLDINASNITKICTKKCKSATSKKDGKKYTFECLS